MPSPGCCPAWPSCGCFLGAEGGEGLFPLVGLGEAIGGGNRIARGTAASRLGMGVAVGLCWVWEEVEVSAVTPEPVPQFGSMLCWTTLGFSHDEAVPA